MLNNSLTKQFLDLKSGSHLILIHNQVEEWSTAVSTFILTGIENNDKCIYISGEYSDDFIKKILRENNIDIEELVAGGQLLFLTKDQLYENEFNIDYILNLLQQQADNAVKGNYNALSITGEISWVVNQSNSLDKIIRYEKIIEEKLFRSYPVKALCRYNMDSFDEGLLKTVIELHPYLVWKSRLYKNPYYISLDSFNSNNLYRKELEEWLNNIDYYTREKDKLTNTIQQEQNKFEFLFNQIDDALFVHGITEDGFTNFEMVNKQACDLLGYTEKELLSLKPEDVNQYMEDFFGDKFERLINDRHIKYESAHITRNRKTIPVENKSHLFELEGRVLVLTIARDIRDRKEKEVQLDERHNEIIKKNRELEKSNNRLKKLIEIVCELSSYSLKTEEEFLKKVFRTSFDMIGEAETGSVYLYRGNKVEFIDAVGHDLQGLKSVRIDKELFTQNNKIRHIKDKNKDFIDKLSNAEKFKFLEVSLPVKESIFFDISSEHDYVGGISLDIKETSSKSFQAGSLKILSAFKNITESFYNIQNYDKLRGKFTKEIVLSMIHMLEFHDKYTTGHSENVAILASDFAENLGMDEREISRVYWAGLVHDIGKIIIPAYILNKKGKLTDQEYKVVKNHPVWAYKTLKRSNQLSDIADYVLHHHERWDGQGYPDNMKDDEIPLISKILAISDTWDAMRSNRAYRDALTYSEAIFELEKNKDSQFSGDLVDKFIQMLESDTDTLFSHR